MPLPPDRILQRRMDVGLDRKTINRIENGHIAPTLDHLLDIAEAIGVSPRDLLPG